MKNVLRLISVLLCICTLMSAALFISAATLYNKNAYGDESECEAINVAKGSSVGIRLGINGEFSSVSVRLSTYLKKDTIATVRVYKWAGSYEDTVETAPIAAKTFNTVKDNEKHNVKINTQQAGEYLINVTNDYSLLAIWKWKNNNVGHGLAYFDGVEEACDINVSVGFTSDVSVPFTVIRSDFTATGSNKAPDEYVPDKNSAVVVRASRPTTWAATDELGRTLPTYEETGGVRSGKTVALFYWSWHVRQDTGEPFNLQNFMEIHPEIKNNYNSSLWPTDPTVYFWNESVYGYYKTNDDWVLRKHAELLADAGVDVIIFDNTNGTFTWKESYDHIFKTFEKALEDGVNVPKITFLLPFWNKSDTDTQVRAIYKDVFYREKYQKLWFYFDGKPMLMCDQSFIDNSDLLGKEIRNYFTFRKPQPEYLTDSKTIYNQWGWLSVYPQTKYKASGKSGVEQITVGVAANHNYKTHKLTAMNDENVTGRTYTSKGIDTRPDAVKYGAHFAEQFEYALAVDPDVIFITGWNEWIVGRYDTWQGVANAFPDEYNDEFSRDIEPTKGKLRDNYYYQMVSYIRKFKGCEQTSVYEVNKRINLNKPLSPQWDKITSSYIAYENNVSDRRSEGYGSKYYKDTSGRNDIVEAKAVVDTDNIYFFVRCKDEITPYSDKNWMTLYIDTDENNKGWETFDYVIGKKTADKDQAYVQKFTGKGYETQIVAKADYAQDGEYLVYAVSKADIGLDKDRDKVMFKWTDNVSDEDGSGVFKGEILDFYRSGDVAPGGRFKYVYSYMTAEPEPEETTDTETETEPEDTADTEKTTDTEKVTDTEETADITDITETEIPTDPEETKEPPAVLRGDCNRDGEVDNKDVVALFRYVSGNDKEKDETVYDFNEDDKVDNKDVVALFRHLSAAQ